MVIKLINPLFYFDTILIEATRVPGLSRPRGLHAIFTRDCLETWLDYSKGFELSEVLDFTAIVTQEDVSTLVEYGDIYHNVFSSSVHDCSLCSSVHLAVSSATFSTYSVYSKTFSWRGKVITENNSTILMGWN